MRTHTHTHLDNAAAHCHTHSQCASSWGAFHTHTQLDNAHTRARGGSHAHTRMRRTHSLSGERIRGMRRRACSCARTLAQITHTHINTHALAPAPAHAHAHVHALTSARAVTRNLTHYCPLLSYDTMVDNKKIRFCKKRQCGCALCRHCVSGTALEFCTHAHTLHTQ